MKRRFLVPVFMVPLSVFVSQLGSFEASPFDRPLSDERQIRHALDRLTYGPRPGDVERVRGIGLDQWMEQQLNPDKIPENPLLESRLKLLESITMTDREIAENYPSREYIRAVARGRIPPPEDPDIAAIVDRIARRYQERERAGQEPEETSLDALLEPAERDILLAGEAPEKIGLLLSMEPVKLGDVFLAMPPEARRGLMVRAPPELRRRLMLSTQPQQVVTADLMEAKLYRAIYSERQLAEVLADFWFNHFNVSLNKGPIRALATSYERDAIRPHVLGHFGEMLLATARHPAMLHYLDNWLSVDPKAAERIRNRRRDALPRARGLNENYARELLELHTLGVDGGYTQQDVVAVARCFTGWSIRDPRRGGGFQFHRAVHDAEEKVVLGHKIPAGGGIEDGLEVIRILVAHPSTAQFISTKLAQRFVADEPPSALVDRMAGTFRKTNGDLREVLRTMLTSREFLSAGAWRDKVKSPLELVASAIRGTGADVSMAFGLAAQIGKMGQPLYQKEEPTGYPNTSGGWMSSAALVSRLNFAQALAANRLPGVKVDLSQWRRNVDDMAASLLGEPPSESTRNAIGDTASSSAVIAGLLLGSPEFQRR